MADRSRAWVEIEPGALRRNLAALRGRVAPGTGVVPMVKADAYGLGLETAVHELRRALVPDGPWAFGVATVAEGERLRRFGWIGRVLVFSPAPPGELARAAQARLTLCLSSVGAARRWAEAARTAGQRLAMHVEIDTGMGRAGLPWQDAATWGAALQRETAGALRWEGCFTHFHSADEPDLTDTERQWRRFQEALDALPDAPPGEPRLTHVANSAATLRRGGFGCDLVRPGVFLYGGAVGGELRPEPVVAVRARLALVREAAAGQSLGYGATYTAPARERWGTVAIGYGDGLPRALWPGGGEALVRGRRVPVIGRVSMDVTTIRLDAVPDAQPGDVVTLIGRDGDAEITVDEVARRAGTISYEILTGLTPRLPRVRLEAGNT